MDKPRGTTCTKPVAFGPEKCGAPAVAHWRGRDVCEKHARLAQETNRRDAASFNAYRRQLRNYQR